MASDAGTARDRAGLGRRSNARCRRRRSRGLVKEELRPQAGEAWAFRRGSSASSAQIRRLRRPSPRSTPIAGSRASAAAAEESTGTRPVRVSPPCNGQPVSRAAEDAAIAPEAGAARSRPLRGRASCCITRTESVATLTTLLRSR